MEASLLRPLPPFRAKPLRKPHTRKAPGSDSRKEGATEISVKARRHPIKIARPLGSPALKVLGRAADGHA